MSIAEQHLVDLLEGFGLNHHNLTSLELDLKGKIQTAFWAGYHARIEEEIVDAKEQETEETNVEEAVPGRTDGDQGTQADRVGFAFPERKSGERNLQTEIAEENQLAAAILQGYVLNLQAVRSDLQRGNLVPKSVQRRINQLQLNIREIQEDKPLTTFRYSG